MITNDTPPVGWSLDGDGWYFRRSRGADPKIGPRSDLGFDDSTFNSPPEGWVYVRSPAIARSIDAGKLPGMQSYG